jgi:hypothetical protein
MATITLASYSLRLRPKYRPKEYELLDALEDGKVSFIRVCKEYFKRAQREYVKQEHLQHLQKASLVKTDDEGVWGTLQSGEYGFESEIWSSDTLVRRFKREREDAELLPFYFHILAPSGGSTAILLLQRYANRGIFTAVANALRDHFSEVLPNYQLETARLVPGEVLQRLLKGKLTEIQITTYSVPHDLAEQFKLGGRFLAEGSLTLTFRAKKAGTIPEPQWVTRLRQRKVQFAELPMDFDPAKTRVKLGYTYKNSTRLMDMARLDAIAPYHDVTDQVKIGSNGHPVFASIHASALELLEELREQLGP